MSWIPTDILRHKRLDAPYYAVEHLETEAMIRRASEHVSFETLGSFARLWSGPFGSKLPSSLYRSVGPYPLFRSQNVKAFWIQRDGLVYLDANAYRELKSCSAETGDILVSKAGFVGTACIVEKDEGPAIITEHVLGVRALDDTDQYFLLATLNSTICRRQLEREGLGTILDYLGVEVSRELLVPRPKRPLQVSIGNKVRAAEKLRVSVRDICKHIDEVFPKLDETEEKGPATWLSSASFNQERLEAQYYETKYLQADIQLSRLGCQVVPLGKLARAMRHGASITGEENYTGGTRFIRGLELLPNRISNHNRVYIDSSTASDLSVAHFLNPGEMLITRSGTVGVCAVTREREAGCAFGSFVIVVRLNESVPPEYIAAFLNSHLGQIQFRREENGAVQMNINNAELARLRVPLFDEKLRESIAAMVQGMNEQLDRTDNLANEAIQDLEDLIEGKLNEATCLEEGRKLAGEFGLEMP
jgi:type I restriction enzyme S subunit